MRPRLRTAAASAAVLIAAGCSGTSSPAATVHPLPPGVHGTFLTLAGDRELNAGLFELTFGPVRLRALSPVLRVTTLGACATRVIVAAAQPEVGFNDHLQSFAAGRFGPVDGLGTPHAYDPVLAPDCRMLYTDFSNPQAEGDMRLHIWDPVTHTNTIIGSYAELGGVSWGPGGAVAWIEGTRTVPDHPGVIAGIVLRSPDGTRRVLPPPANDLTRLEWSSTGWLAAGRKAAATVFLQPDTGEHRLLTGWQPVVWSPDGHHLLVCDAAHRRLGLVTLPDLAEVLPLGTAPTPIFGTVWLPAGSDPTRP